MGNPPRGPLGIGAFKIIAGFYFLSMWAIIYLCVWFTLPAHAPTAPVIPYEPVRLCPVEGEVLQLPCKHIPWMGKA